MTVALRETRDGVAFTIVCRPGAPRTRSRGTHGDALKLDVGAPPERGRANEDVIRFLARELGVTRDALRITAGTASREKSVRVLGKTCAEIAPALARLAASTDA